MNDWPIDRCPNCGEWKGTQLDETLRLCFACRHEWKPAETSGPVDGATFDYQEAPVAPTTVPLVAVPDLPALGPVELARQRFVGSAVVSHELEAEGLLTEITDDGDAVIEFGSGYSVTVGPDDFSVVAYSPLDDETAQALAATDMTVAATIIRAGRETLRLRGDEIEVGVPPDGFLPADPDVMPVIEHGAAYAIAIIATTCGISIDDLSALADRLEAAATAARGATDDE